jgi:peptide/nickel transport system permease protein
MSLEPVQLDAGAELASASSRVSPLRSAMPLATTLLRRLAQMIIVTLLVFVITFALIHVIPGDPARMILGKIATPEAVAALRERLGLDEPLLSQFAGVLGRALHGDLGTSLVSRTQTVTDIAVPAFINTLGLVTVALAISVIVGGLLGVIAGVRGSGVVDRAIQSLMVLLLATPPFMFGFLLLLLALGTRIAPAGGWNSTPLDSLPYVWLPALALSAALTPIIARSLRQSVRESLREDFVEAAIARGIPMTAVVRKHVLPNSLLPIVGLVGYSVGGLIGGAAVVEVVFNIPGLGSAMMGAVASRDFPVIQGIALISAITVILVNAIADAGNWLIDPRTRAAG